MRDIKEVDIDPALLEEGGLGLTSRIRMWLDDHNPLPYRVRWWFRDCDLLHPVRVWHKLGNLARWAPLLWDDVDWDYSSLYIMMHTKLRFMRECLEENHSHTDWQETVVQLRTAEDCLSRLATDDYIMEEFVAHNARFPRDLRWVDLPDGNRQLVPMSDEEHEAFFKIVHKEEALRQADLETFAKQFVEHSRGWWD